MMLGIAETVAIAERCAPSVASQTLLAIVQVESSFNPLAIGVNGSAQQARAARAPESALARAAKLAAAGVSFDLGLAQINARNLASLRLSLRDAFDPCRNLAAAALLLGEAYDRAIEAGEAPQAALRTALSTYNTGHPRRGFANGYVAKVLAASERFAASVEPEPPTSPPLRYAPATPPTPTPSISFVFSFAQGARP